jgi:hypothetical protein
VGDGATIDNRRGRTQWIGNGRSELEAGAGSIQQHRLNLALEEAKATTTGGAGSGSDPAHVLDSVHITMETPMANDKGWNVIALDYIVAPPLNAVITPTAVAKYKRVFGMMWRLQRLEHCLTRVWLTTVTSATHIFSKAFKDTPGMPFSTSHPRRAVLRCAVRLRTTLRCRDGQGRAQVLRGPAADARLRAPHAVLHWRRMCAGWR